MTLAAHRILIADDEEGLRFVLRELLTREGCQVDEAEDGEQAVELARTQGYDLYLLDMKMPRRDGLEALREIRQLYPDALAVMITAYGSQQLAIEALKAGAYDYFTKPFHIEELRLILMRALEKQTLQRKLRLLEEQLCGKTLMGGMVGQGPAMRQVFSMIERVAEHDVTVLITGESGTGKELVARAIHDHSARRAGPLIKINCAAIPEPLLESELFGHEKGSFTGAICAKPGKFELADGGTILLDEIGEMPPALQVKLLRVLQERVIERVGSNTPRPVNLRVLTSTNRDLAAMVREKTFREDLYFRINVIPIALPPLRERHEDLPTLVHHFIENFNTRFGKRIAGVTPEAMGLLERYRWPGNVRELENTLQRAVVMAHGTMIDRAALPEALREAAGDDAPHGNGANHGNGNTNGNGANGNGNENGKSTAESFALPLAERIEQLTEREERRIILAALAKMGGHREKSADLLRISRKSLHNKMQKYGLFDREEK